MEGATASFGQKYQRVLVLADLVAAAVFTAGALTDVAALGRRVPWLAAVVLSVACTTAVGWRRRAPVAAALVAATAMMAYQLVTADPRMTFEPYAVALCYYLAGRYGPRRHPRLVPGLLAGYGLLTLGFEVHGAWVAQVMATGLAFVLLPMGLGLLAARYGSMARALTATLTQLEQEQRQREQRAASDERHRVARELHDVLGHCISVMVIQAGAARLVAEADPAGARRALETVPDCGREALADLRRFMGVTRRDDDLTGPGPGLAQLGSLAERATAAGVPTSVRIDDPQVTLPGALPDAVDLACYRVVQEALTNVVKHAGRARAEVRVRMASGVVTVTVTDTGGRGSAPVQAAQDGPGHGINGLRERVALHGGSLEAGPRAAGFLVEARIPLSGEPPAATADPRDRSRTGGSATGDAPGPARTGRAPAGARRLGELGRRRLDPLLALGWLVALEAAALTSNHRHGPLALNLVVVAAMALAGLWRRRAPLVFLAATVLLSLPLSQGLTSRDYATLVGVYTVLIPPYAVGAWAKRPRAVAAIVVWAVAVTGAGLAQHAGLSGLAGPLLAAGTAWAAGVAVQAQRQLSAKLRDAAARLAAEREERARQATLGEQARIARDLQVLVARRVVTMVVQAEVARDRFDVSRAEALTAMTAIEDAGREALTEMRRILDVLRHPGQVPDLRPSFPVNRRPRTRALA
ncbi:MAG TPA: histidine kinase [Streptosporangiaceae bacterium]|nr:histidine kinase [Streptosporangiaceae bacterium]